MKVLSAVLLFVAVLVGYVYGESCPTIPSNTPSYIKSNFKPAEFVKINPWYEVKTMNYKYVDGGCVSIKYSEDKTNLKADYKFFNNAEEYTKNFVLKREPDAENNYLDTYKIYDKDDKPIHEDKTKYQILTTDYKNYAVIYGCTDGKETTEKYTQKISILSAKSTLEPKYEGLVEFIIKSLMNVPTFEDGGWKAVEQDKAKCSSASIFAVSTILNVIVVMLVLRN